MLSTTTTRLGAALLTAVLTVTAPMALTTPAAQATGVNNQGVHMLERGDEGADVTRAAVPAQRPGRRHRRRR